MFLRLENVVDEFKNIIEKCEKLKNEAFQNKLILNLCEFCVEPEDVAKKALQIYEEEEGNLKLIKEEALARYKHTKRMTAEVTYFSHTYIFAILRHD